MGRAAAKAPPPEQPSGKRTSAKAPPPEQPSGWSAVRWPLVAVILAGVALRVAYLLDYRAHSVFWDAMLLDAEIYDAWARRIAEGDWLSGSDVFTLPPLYPYFLAVLYKVAGYSHVAVYVLQSMMGLANLYLIWSIGRKVFAGAVPLIAVALAVLYGSFMFMESKLLSTTLALTLGLSLMRLMLVAGEHQTLALWGACGLLLGVTALARPETLLFAPLALWWILRVTRAPDRLVRRARTDQFDLAGRQPWFAAAVFTAFVIIAVSPATLRNWVVTGDWSLSNLISSQAGITFHQSNNPKARGLYVFLDEEGFSGDPTAQAAEEKTLAEKATGRPMKRSEVTRYWMNRGLDWIFANPGKFLLLEAKKLQRFLGSYEYSTEYIIYVERETVRTLWLCSLPFGVIAALGLIGILARFREKLDSPAMLLMAFVAANFTVVMLFYVSSRYRMPSAPFLILFAGSAIDRLARGFRSPLRADRTEAWMFTAVALVLLGIFQSQVDQSARVQEANVHYNAGNKYYGKQLFEEAVVEYRRAVAMDASNWRAYFNMGNTLGERLNRPAEAIEAYRGVLRKNPGFAPAERQIRRFGEEP